MSKEIDGLSDLMRNLKIVCQEQMDAALDGAEDAMDFVGEEGSRIIPHETGDLDNSFEVSRDDTTRTVAGSYDTPYALRQHEDMTLRHDDGRSAKWFEKSLNSNADKIVEIIAESVIGRTRNMRR